MNYGGISFGHVLSFQIRIMMGNQYLRLVEAMKSGDRDGILVACLRLGWNDAFRHVSENKSDADIIAECEKRKELRGIPKKSKDGTATIDDTKKNEIIIHICRSVLGEFREYAQKTSTTDRRAYIHEKLKCTAFVEKFAVIKVTDPKNSNKSLRFGHIQKMFNMALKLYLCLKICAEEYPVILQYGATPDENILLKAELFDLFDAESFSADCPIDHYILEAMDSRIDSKGSSHTPVKPRNQQAGFKKYGSIKWSQLSDTNDEDYIDIQDEIASLQNDPDKCNLCFDFENWNS